MKATNRRGVFRTENVLWVNFRERRASSAAVRPLRGVGIVPWPLYLPELYRARKRDNAGQS